MESIYASLLNSVDRRSIDAVAHALGQPEQAVSRGMESSIAGLLAGLANKSSDPSALRRILDIVPSSLGTVSWSQIAGALGDPNSSLIAAGKRLLPALFGAGENTVNNGISRASGLPLGAISPLLAMAGPVVMGFIGKHLRDGGMTINGLASLLQKDSVSIRSHLPAELTEMFWPDTARVATASPVVAQTVQKERSSGWILPALAIAAATALGLAWLLNHAHRPTVPVTSIPVMPVPTGGASRLAPTAPKMTCTVPASVQLPEGGVASRLLTFVQNPDTKLQETTWFDLDQMRFDTGSARIRPESQAELNNIAAILTNCPTVHMIVAGHTDNVGNADANLRLSRSRANGVVNLLVNQGISPDRLTAEGYGEGNPVADNSTADGRAQNRRVAMRVTQK
jgi:outer membrane protein OmpA-like peptidoglycan-associated protein